VKVKLKRERQILNFYSILAYKRKALLNHPDRLPSTASSEQREEATRKFQLVADAYYILGDRSRRESYDKSKNKKSKFTAFQDAMPNASTGQANNMFGNVFEELLRPEGKTH
jgi:curved DNA-binding protein CbpA